MPRVTKFCSRSLTVAARLEFRSRRRQGVVTRYFIRLFIAALLCALSTLAADISGIWVGQVPGRNGEPQDVAFKFTQNGSALAGKLYGDYQSSPITKGIIAVDLITFTITVSEQSGNQINDSKLRFSGTIKNGEMELTREREGATIAGNGGSVSFKGNAKQKFRLKRLL